MYNLESQETQRHYQNLSMSILECVDTLYLLMFVCLINIVLIQRMRKYVYKNVGANIIYISESGNANPNNKIFLKSS